MVDFIAAGTGLVLVALQIAYLPTLYSRLQPPRNAGHPAGEPGRVPRLGARAPHPPPTGRLIDNLASLFAEWERWAADVTESHCTYPSLLYLRSPGRTQQLGAGGCGPRGYKCSSAGLDPGRAALA